MTPEEMALLHARAFGDTARSWTAREFAGLLASPHVFVTGDARAFALFRVAAEEAELLTIACDPARRRQGLARAALAKGEAEAARRGTETLFLDVAADNHAARALYAACGYRQIARRSGYYKRPGADAVDALILRKSGL